MSQAALATLRANDPRLRDPLPPPGPRPQSAQPGLRSDGWCRAGLPPRLNSSAGPQWLPQPSAARSEAQVHNWTGRFDLRPTSVLRRRPAVAVVGADAWLYVLARLYLLPQLRSVAAHAAP